MIMRLGNEEVELIKQLIQQKDDQAKVYLFGSRTDNHQKGGDIDLLIVSKKIDRRAVREIRMGFFDKFGEQKLDVIVDNGQFLEPFHRLAYEGSVRL